MQSIPKPQQPTAPDRRSGDALSPLSAGANDAPWDGGAVTKYDQFVHPSPDAAGLPGNKACPGRGLSQFEFAVPSTRRECDARAFLQSAPDLGTACRKRYPGGRTIWHPVASAGFSTGQSGRRRGGHHDRRCRCSDRHPGSSSSPPTGVRRGHVACDKPDHAGKIGLFQDGPE
jgi:hypothetical protein